MQDSYRKDNVTTSIFICKREITPCILHSAQVWLCLSHSLVILILASGEDAAIRQ